MQAEAIDTSPKTELLNLYQQMYLIREFEERAGEMYTRGLIRGFLHLYSGEEAIAVGAISNLEDRDYVVTHYRDHGHALARDKVIAPSTPADALGLLRSALSDPNPVPTVEHVLMYQRKGMVPDDHFTVTIGEADIRRPGSDVTIVSYHHAMVTAMEVADKLAAKDISAEVIDLRTLRPLDMPTIIESVQKTNRVLLLEENWKTGGIMGEIAAQIQEKAFDYLDGPIARVGAEDVPHPYNRSLEQSMLPSADKAMAVLSAAYGI